jgi:hypothetical protein
MTKEERKAYQKAYREKNKERIALRDKEYKERNKDRYKEQRKKRYQENKEIIREQRKEYLKKWYQDNKEKRYKQAKEWNENHREKNREYVKKWKDKNQEWYDNYYQSYKDRKNKLENFRRKTNPKFRLDKNISSGIRAHLKYNQIAKANRQWESLVGYTCKELMEHLESKFKPEMNWDNYGTYWHIDHIKPKSWFDYTSTDEQSFKDCWALNNLQPLEAHLNWSKNNFREG